MATENIGLTALFNDRDFQAGLARYTSGLKQAESATSRAATSMTSLGHTISTALGTALGMISFQSLERLASSIANSLMAPLNVLRSYGGAMDTFRETLGMSEEAAAQFVVGMKAVGLAPEEGAAALSYFVRQVAATQSQLREAGASFADTSAEIRANFVEAQAEAAASALEVWADFAERRAEIEASTAERVAEIQADLGEEIASIQESLSERLRDIAEERAEVERDLAKSLERAREDYVDRMRNARSARERRQIRKDYAQQKRDLQEQAAERKRQLDKEEARAREQAAKQMAQAEKVAAKQIAAAEKAAQKQIEAAEKAAQKQTEAIEKALQKQEEARDKSLKKAGEAMAKTTIASPFAKALAALGLTMDRVTDKAGNLTEEGLNQIIAAFQKLPPGIKSSNIAMELFGRNAIKFLDWMRSDPAEAKKWISSLMGLSQEAKQFDLDLAKLQLQFDLFGIAIGRAVLPSLTKFVEGLRGVMEAGMPLVNDLLNNITAGFKKNGLQGGLDALKQWIESHKPQINEVATKFGEVLRSFLEALTGTVEFVGGAMSLLCKMMQDWVATPEGQSWINNLTTTLGNAITAALQLFIRTSTMVANLMVSLCQKLIEWITSEDGRAWLSSVANALLTTLAGLINWRTLFPNSPGPAPNPYVPYAEGGWVPKTMPILAHAGEYVLNREQARAWAPALAGASYSRTVNNNNFYHNWPAGTSARDIALIESMVRRVSHEEFTRSMERG